MCGEGVMRGAVPPCYQGWGYLLVLVPWAPFVGKRWEHMMVGPGPCRIRKGVAMRGVSTCLPVRHLRVVRCVLRGRAPREQACR